MSLRMAKNKLSSVSCLLLPAELCVRAAPALPIACHCVTQLWGCPWARADGLPCWGCVLLCWGHSLTCWGHALLCWGHVLPCWGQVLPCWGYVLPHWGHAMPCWENVLPQGAHILPAGDISCPARDVSCPAGDLSCPARDTSFLTGDTFYLAGDMSSLSWGDVLLHWGCVLSLSLLCARVTGWLGVHSKRPSGAASTAWLVLVPPLLLEPCSAVEEVVWCHQTTPGCWWQAGGTVWDPAHPLLLFWRGSIQDPGLAHGQGVVASWVPGAGLCQTACPGEDQ